MTTTVVVRPATSRTPSGTLSGSTRTGMRCASRTQLRRDVIDPLTQRIKRLAAAARKSGELTDDRLVKNPHLLLAPIWAGIVLNKFLDRANPVDIGELFEAQLDLVFSRPGK